ncbi:MAG: peptide chain release factor N(5)-glutamine methyltransferase [Bacilli bacterium]|nr:peptide chain release factor N(5)-glutamine methyltransferase [Bacilli bacterium]
MKDNIIQKDLELLKEKYPDNLDEVLKQIDNGYPIQYLIGNVEFLDSNILVNENVLIPRYETEYLVDKTINYLKGKENLKILDIGTGSGCIAISLKKVINCNVTAIDISPKALEVAKDNAKRNNVEIKFIEKDILNNDIEGIYDVIISNPPYVAYNEEVDIKTKYEPQNAIFSDNNGLIFYENILKKSVNHINKNGLIAFEIGMTQGRDIKSLALKYYKNAKVTIEKDLTNRDRYIFIFLNNE